MAIHRSWHTNLSYSDVVRLPLPTRTIVLMARVGTNCPVYEPNRLVREPNVTDLPTPIQVLLVEDNPGDAGLLQVGLEATYQGQFAFQLAQRLAIAEELLATRPYNIILLDLQLPDSTGLDTLDRLAAKANGVPILVMTGQTDQAMAMEAVRRGADDYLIKGESTSRAIARAIRYAMDRQAAQKALQDAYAQLEQRVRDRTADLRATVEALRQSQDRLARVVSDAPIILWTASPEGVITFVAGRIEPLGMEQQDIIGKPITLLAGGDHIRQPFQQALDGWQTSTELHQGVLVFEARLGPLRDSAGNITGALCVATDVTEKRRVENELLLATEREQRRIGRDLHDSIQGSIAGTAMMIDVLARDLQPTNEPAAQRLRQIKSLLHDTLAQVRGLAKGLCPVELKADGLMNALRMLASTISSMFRVDCRLECPQSVLLENETMATNLYFIAQEAINNAVKHAKGRQILISLEQSGDLLRLAIEDNGAGLSPDIIRDPAACGLGLRTMQYRARLINGDLRIGSGRLGGTLVECTVATPSTDAITTRQP